MNLPCAGRWFESIFGDENSEYKRWVRRLYDLGLIPRIPSMWEAPETQEGKSPA
jgi:hypothetical protein